mmetsp:Transcript_31418/g.27766  ORF Transcript_31418/g.27766 Transcript_31418/m.27766 type:complete len:116 (+) Transcript_31418:967-1314(+)
MYNHRRSVNCEPYDKTLDSNSMYRRSKKSLDISNIAEINHNFAVKINVNISEVEKNLIFTAKRNKSRLLSRGSRKSSKRKGDHYDRIGILARKMAKKRRSIYKTDLAKNFHDCSC